MSDKIHVVFTDDENKLDGKKSFGYWKHNRKRGQVTIYIRKTLSPRWKLLTLVHELTEALAANLTKYRNFNQSHHDLADGIETLAMALISEMKNERS